MGAIISKTGCYIPNFAVRNNEFLDNSFLDNDGNPFLKKKEPCQFCGAQPDEKCQKD